MGFVYLLIYVPRFIFKIGVTKTPARRVKDINKSVPGQLVLPLVVIYAINYEAKEKRLHDLFKNVRFTFKGSGKTELFRFGLFRLALCLVLLAWFQLELILLAAAFAVVVYLIIV